MLTRYLLAAMLLHAAASSAVADPVTYEGRQGPGAGKHIVFLAGDHEYRSEETLPALARILAVHHGFKCTVLFTVDPKTGEIDPAADFLPGTEVLETADLAVIFLRFKNLPTEQMQPIVDYLARAGPVVGLRTATHAFKIPGDAPFARFDYVYDGKDYPRGFGRQVLGESWSGHYGKNHVMSTRLEVVPEARSHPIMSGVGRPWVQSGGYWTEPSEDSTVLALAQPLTAMTRDAPPAKDKQPCPGAWVREYAGEQGGRGRVFTTTYGASEDLLDEDFRRMLVNACLWCAGLEAQIAADLEIGFVGGYHPVTFQFGGNRRGVKPEQIAALDTPIFAVSKPVVVPLRRRRSPRPMSLFDGQTLTGWSGDTRFWSVEDGAITGRTTVSNPTPENTFCVWQGGEVADFDLQFQFRIEAHNSGVQFRSFQLGDDPFRIGGYQADIDAAGRWVGTLYGEKFRGVLARRGEQAVVTHAVKRPQAVNGREPQRLIAQRRVAALGDPAELARHVSSYPAWNTFRVVAQGFVMQQYINGKLMCELTDHDELNRRAAGLLALQLHKGPPMKVQFRKIELTKF